MSAPVQSDWIEWAGGECPVARDAMVHIRCRDGWDTEKVSRSQLSKGGYEAGPLRWTHEVNYFDGGDIIAYRVVSK